MGCLDYFTSSFSGFNKKTGYYEKDFLCTKKAWDGRYKFIEDTYKKVADDIKSVLGDKKVYSGQEAYFYFHKRYFAFPIDYRFIGNYANIEYVNFGAYDECEIEDDGALEKFSGDVGKFFAYLKDGKHTEEKTITAVIDLSNDALRERFPKIREYYERYETHLREKYGSFERLYNGFWGYFIKDPRDGKMRRPGGDLNNVIIVIGSLDGNTINSMNVLTTDGFIEEIGYAVEFFRRNS